MSNCGPGMNVLGISKFTNKDCSVNQKLSPRPTFFLKFWRMKVERSQGLSFHQIPAHCSCLTLLSFWWYRFLLFTYICTPSPLELYPVVQSQVTSNSQYAVGRSDLCHFPAGEFYCHWETLQHSPPSAVMTSDVPHVGKSISLVSRGWMT